MSPTKVYHLADSGLIRLRELVGTAYGTNKHTGTPLVREPMELWPRPTRGKGGKVRVII